MDEDLFKFLKSEYVPIPKDSLRKDIEHIHEMDAHLKEFDTPKFIVEVSTKKKIKLMTRLEAVKYIESNIDHLTEFKKLRYKISYIKPSKQLINN